VNRALKRQKDSHLWTGKRSTLRMSTSQKTRCSSPFSTFYNPHLIAFSIQTRHDSPSPLPIDPHYQTRYDAQRLPQAPENGFCTPRHTSGQSRTAQVAASGLPKDVQRCTLGSIGQPNGYAVIVAGLVALLPAHFSHRGRHASPARQAERSLASTEPSLCGRA